MSKVILGNMVFKITNKTLKVWCKDRIPYALSVISTRCPRFTESGKQTQVKHKLYAWIICFKHNISVFLFHIYTLKTLFISKSVMNMTPLFVVFKTISTEMDGSSLCICFRCRTFTSVLVQLTYVDASLWCVVFTFIFSLEELCVCLGQVNNRLPERNLLWILYLGKSQQFFFTCQSGQDQASPTMGCK